MKRVVFLPTILRRRGFTLIELLVVVAILAGLIAILIPSLSRARTVAKRSRCLANVRNMGQNMQFYYAEFRDLLPYGRDGGVGTGVFWTNAIRKYTPGGEDKLLQCPEAFPNPDNSGTTLVNGSANLAWSYPAFGPPIYGYAMNGWLYHSGLGNPTRTPPGDAGCWTVDPRRNPSSIPLFADSIWCDAWPIDTDPPPASAAELVTGGSAAPPGLGVFNIARHGKAINIVFFDGHADTVILRELTKQLWNIKWARTTTQTVP